MAWLALAGNTGFVSAPLFCFLLGSQPALQPVLYVLIILSMDLLKKILHKQFEALHVGVQTILFVLASVNIMPFQRRWINYKLAPKGSKWKETLHFLLDHPRRCFIYLFPSRQTWFLLTVLIVLKQASYLPTSSSHMAASSQISA